MAAVDADVRDKVAGQRPLRLLDSLGKGRTPLCRVRPGQGQRDDVAPPLEQRAGPGTAGGALHQDRSSRPLDQLRHQTGQGIARAHGLHAVPHAIDGAFPDVHACHCPALLR